jgi:acyl carrier protein
MTAAELTVIKVLNEVMTGKGLAALALRPETALDGRLGLESLDFAELVVRLEEITGKDPFSSATVPQVQTISELAALY